MNLPDINKGIAIDIDETLADTNLFWLNQLFFINQFQDRSNYFTLEYELETQKFIKNIPALYSAEVQKWIGDQIFSNASQLNVPAIISAKKAVDILKEKNIFSCYLTARPSSVVSGTRQWLLSNGFPDLPIIAKPEFPPNDKRWNGSFWKAEILCELYPELQGLVDDNESICEHLPSSYQGSLFIIGGHKYPGSYSYLRWFNSWENLLEHYQELNQ